MKTACSDLRSLTNYSREDGKNGKKKFPFPLFPSSRQKSWQRRDRNLLSTLASLFFLLLAASCSNKKNNTDAAPKIAKTVPANYFNAGDSGFSRHQDTLYYKDNFFSGYLFLLYPTGDTAFIQSYFNGVEEGLQKRWYDNKQVAEERFYINGKKEGIHKGWWPDGKPKFVFEVSGNEYNGEFKEWYSSGLLGKQFHYHNGQEEGSERLWWDNGTVRANYVIKNGRKYGLIGLKTCVNPYDSVIKK